MESNTSSQAGSREGASTGPASWSDDRRRLDRALAEGVGVVRDVLLQLDPVDRLATLGKIAIIFDSLEADAIAQQLAAGVPTRKVEDIVHKSGRGGSSKRTVKQKTRRGAVLLENPDLGNKMADGTLSAEQVDVLAAASAKTDGDAAHDVELIEKVAAGPPEQAKKVADEFVRNRLTQDDVDAAYAKARKARRLQRYSNEERGTDVLLIEGPAVDIDRIESRIDDISDRFYRDDGGRDVASCKHQRTRDQRRFDAAMALLGEGESGERGDGSNAAQRPARARSEKSVIIIKATLEQARGDDPTPLVLADGAPLPKAVVDRLACGSDFVGQVFSADGEILSQGRAVRSATFAQRLTLISRDGGCVLCGLSHSKCVAHHLDPWTSQLLGETNTDRMVLVCTDCHGHIHDNELTLYRDSDGVGGGVWRTRPARPEELPANGPRRSDSQRGQRRKNRPASRPTAETALPNENPLFTQRE